jgi:hypothetical protein
MFTQPMFTEAQTSHKKKGDILNEAGLFVLNIYKLYFKHAIGGTSHKSPQKTRLWFCPKWYPIPYYVHYF